MNQIIKDIKYRLDEQEKKAICNVSYSEFKEEFVKQLKNACYAITAQEVSSIDELTKIAYKSMKVLGLLQDKNNDIWKQLLTLFIVNIFETICDLGSEEK